MPQGSGRRKALAWLVGISVATTACGGGGPARGGQGTGGPALVFAAEQEPSGFNVHVAGGAVVAARNVVENVFFYAVKTTPRFTLEFPGLERPPAVLSRSPQVVEWSIRGEAGWSDGTPVTSEDLRYFHSQVTDPANDVASRVGYEQITRLEVVDERTIRATFDPPFADFEALWADVPQAAHLKAQPGGWNSGLRYRPGPSAGPYLFREWRRGESLTLVRNPRWWGEEKPGLGSIVFRFLPDPSSQVRALANGEVDMIAPQPTPDLVAEARRVAGVRTEVSFGPRWEHLTFNLANPILADLRVRRAIAHAVDRDLIVRTLLAPVAPAARRLDSFVYMANQPEFEAHGQEYRAVDPAAARRLLDEAGWRLGPDGVRAKGGRRLSLRLSTTSGNAGREQQEELVRIGLASVGVEVVVDNCPSQCLFGDRLPRADFDIATFAWAGGVFAASGVRAIYQSGSRLNYGGLSSAAFDELMGRAAVAPDRGHQARLANRADVVLWAELPGLPLYQKPTFFAVRDRFVGMADNSTGDGIFWNSHTWSLRKGRG